MTVKPNAVGLQGLICPRSGANVPFDSCFGTCKSPCMSRPLLLALSGSERIVEPDTYHVTEILDPPQKVYYTRNRPYYINPMNQVFALLGSAVHNVVADQHQYLVGTGYRVEESFTAKVGDYILSGRFDLFDTDAKVLWDYKTMKCYPVRALMAGDFASSKHAEQLNIYNVYAGLNAKRLMIEAIVKDHNYEAELRDGITPVVDIEVPIFNEKVVVDRVESLIGLHAKCQKNPELIPECPPEDLWFPKSPKNKRWGTPLRCQEYCNAKDSCPQYKKWKIDNA